MRDERPWYGHPLAVPTSTVSVFQPTLASHACSRRADYLTLNDRHAVVAAVCAAVAAIVVLMW